MSVTKKKTLQITVADNIGLVEFTRPKEMNSFIREQYLYVHISLSLERCHAIVSLLTCNRFAARHYSRFAHVFRWVPVRVKMCEK